MSRGFALREAGAGFQRAAEKRLLLVGQTQGSWAANPSESHGFVIFMPTCQEGPEAGGSR